MSDSSCLFKICFCLEHSVMSHISAIELLASQLKDLNEPVTEAQVMTKILVTLPPSYRHFLSVWDNVPPKSRNIQTLTQRLLKEENVTKIYNNGQTDDADSAFFTNNFPSQQGDCFTRGGHDNRRSRGRSDRSTGSTSRHPYVRKCNYCGDTTHLYATCRNRLRKERKEETGAVAETSNLANDVNITMMTTAIIHPLNRLFVIIQLGTPIQEPHAT